MISIREIQDQDKWNTFLQELNPNTFLQSWQWGQFQQQDGEKVRYLGIFKDEQQIGACLLLTINARRGRHLLIPHGPIFVTEVKTRAYLSEIIRFARSLAREDRAVCLRIAPLLEATQANQTSFRNLGFRPAPLHVHAELTWVLDINKPAEQLLAEMRKTTRHAIKRAEDAEVKVEITTSVQALERFYPLYEQTKSRHDFIPYSRQTLLKQFEIFASAEAVYLAIASHEGKDIAAGIFFQFGNTAFYYHGASAAPAPQSLGGVGQLLQWESIKEAKRRGATYYNFWGIAPDSEPGSESGKKHPFAGITVFKKGFGGYAIDYMHAQDLPFSPRYWKLWLVEQLRKKKRGF